MSQFAQMLLKSQESSEAMRTFGPEETASTGEGTQPREALPEDTAVKESAVSSAEVKPEVAQAPEVNEAPEVKEEPAPEEAEVKEVVFLGERVSAETGRNLNTAASEKFSKELNFGKEKFKLIKLKASQVTPLKPKAVQDTGRISERLRGISEKAGVKMIPVSTTRIPEVVKLRDYTVVEFQGEKYFAPTNDEVDLDNLKKLAGEAAATIENGDIFNIDLFVKTFNDHGEQFTTLRFTEQELVDFTTLLQEYHPKVVSLENGGLRLVAGDFIFE